METLTLEQRIGILEETKQMPVGQRCRKLQYPIVTMEQLAERFAVHKIATAYNAQQVETVYIELAKQNGISLEEAHKRFSVDLKNGIAQENNRDVTWVTTQVVSDSNSLISMGSWEQEILRRLNNGPKITAIPVKHCIGRVVIEALDHYMGDEIPPRVLDSLEVAKECGLSEFMVAYPVIDIKDITVTTRQEHDPVLLAKLGDKLLEIDMWE